MWDWCAHIPSKGGTHFVILSPLCCLFFPILSSCLLQTSRVFSDLKKKFSATCSYNWSDRLSVTLTWLVIRLSCRSAQPGHNTTNVNFHQSFFLAIGLLVTRHWLRTDAQSNDVLGWLFFFCACALVSACECASKLTMHVWCILNDSKHQLPWIIDGRQNSDDYTRGLAKMPPYSSGPSSQQNNEYTSSTNHHLTRKCQLKQSMCTTEKKNRSPMHMNRKRSSADLRSYKTYRAVCYLQMVWLAPAAARNEYSTIAEFGRCWKVN